MANLERDYDVLVIGSGFGGSVTALRLTEKGYRVGVIEAGRRFADDDYGKTNWKTRRFIWAPKLGCYGIQRIHLLNDVVVLAGAGVGGGSLVYANTLYEPQTDAFYNDQQWAHIADWKTELAPHYDQAKRMLGVVLNPTQTAADDVLQKVADKMGVGSSYHAAPVGVFFGCDDAKEPGKVSPDPYFGGAGPDRAGCLECGECMSGCRHNAKNTLVKNYLYLAEQAGAKILPMSTVTRVRPLAGSGYAVEIQPTGKRSKKRAYELTAEHVVFAAGTWGTQTLLHKMQASGDLPNLSKRLGMLTRTNSESICSANVKLRNPEKLDFHNGVAITSSIHPDDRTHIEPVRYGIGSSSMAGLLTLMTDGGGNVPRVLKWLSAVVRHPINLLNLFVGLRSWSRRTIIALVMQTHDNSITVLPKRTWTGKVKLTSKQGHGEPNPTWIPAANEATRLMAEEIGGVPFSSIGEIFNVPMTAHFLGGVVIGDSTNNGVVDAYHRVFGHEGLHVVDGAAISANIGVNPSLTITAQAERAMSIWPNKGEYDTRPPLGERYLEVERIWPKAPVVPRSAPAALPFPTVRPDAATRKNASLRSTTE
ncbi:cholesterol oxidase [Nocardia mangyaensis]|uniref:Cholesterol oxidase n=1 Tax=Nocardia mangyaensis TaxID=2213200 RepID=A0A1J0VYK7_9NOCA|nr:GMC family oxidoreductase [Nocardia mangyaensis]APE37081.1 cholesterol oxidase [Nocardia mangyaensis]